MTVEPASPRAAAVRRSSAAAAAAAAAASPSVVGQLVRVFLGRCWLILDAGGRIGADI